MTGRQGCDWRELTCHDALTVADFAARMGWMVVGCTETTWADDQQHVDESLILTMGRHDGSSAVRIFAFWVDVNQRHADHHHFTVQHLDADLNITGKREVRHNPEMILRSLITRHGVIDLDEVA